MMQRECHGALTQARTGKSLPLSSSRLPLSSSRQPRRTLPAAAAVPERLHTAPLARVAPALAAAVILSEPVQGLALAGTQDSPYFLQDKVEFGVDPATGSLRPCPSNVNPNCVSTGSTNQLYGPAWRANGRDAQTAAKELESTIAELFEPEQYELVNRASLPGGEYRAFGFTSALGEKKDVTEQMQDAGITQSWFVPCFPSRFYIKNEGVTTRNWEGDSEGALVTYRSVAGQVRYIWPISQPISDFGVQRGRLYSIRRALGWGIVGCEADVAECSEVELASDTSLKSRIRAWLSLLGS